MPQTFTQLNPANQQFYDRTLLSRLLPKLTFLKHGQKRPIPKNEGDTVNFRRYGGLDPALTPLVEGVTPPPDNLTMQEITATVEGYGNYIYLTDKIKMAGIDPVATEATEILGEQAGETLDIVVRDIVANGTNVYRVNGRAAITDVAGGDVLDGVTLRRVRQIMVRNNVKPPAGRDYIAFVHPDTIYDLMGDSNWVNAQHYSGATKIFNGEIGRMYGIRFIETTLAPVWENAGAGAAVDVYGTIVIGKDAYGVPDIAGSSKPKTYVKSLGSAGTGDPIDQRSSIGWKAYLTAVRLQELAILRLEHAASAPA